MGLLSIGFGLGLPIAKVFVPLWQAAKARSWTETRCRMLESEVVPIGATERSSSGYRLRVRYSFTAGGEPRVGTRHGFGVVPTGFAEVAVVRDRLGPGTEVTCRYDPDDPSESVIDPTPRPVPAALSALVFALAGVFFLWEELQRPGRARRDDRDAARVVRQRGADLPFTALKVAFAITFASATVVQFAVAPWWISLVFVVASGALVAWAGHAVGQRMTEVELRIEPAEPRTNARTELSWQVRTAVLRRGQVTLIGRESVRSESSDRPDVECREFFTRRLGVAGRGRASVTLPADLPPSQTSGSARIEWVVRVVADLVLWPDLKVDIPIGVSAEPGEASGGRAARAEGAAGLVLEVDDAGVGPGGQLRGRVAWRREVAPKRATVRLGWRARRTAATGEVGAELSAEVIGELAVQELPRVVRTAGGDGPYRARPEDDRGPLAASDERRFSLDLPTGPWSFRGELFELDWELQVELDGDTVGVPVTLGPGGRAVVVPARAG